jgi:LPXTG-motif cell wall-anchored protein
VVVPSVKTGEMWSGWMWWAGAISIGVAGVFLTFSRRQGMSTTRR